MTQFTPVEIALSVILLTSLFIQLIYYWILFSRLAFLRKQPPATTEQPPVSVVIAARNEYHHLKKNLPAILEQKYPYFEVVVVNHASDDETADYLKELQNSYPQLKIVTIERDLNFFHGKKFPLSIGIKSATHEILLLTDADCKPASPYWISRMASNYNDRTEVMLGYGPYNKEKGFLNRLIRYDTFLVALQYLSFALAGKPYMGVGRNLSYRKSLFLKNKGFIAHYLVASGDDDLFINEVAQKENTRVELSSEAFVYSEPKHTFGEWLRQKRRHLSTGKKYKLKFKFLLGMFSLSLGIYYLSAIILLAVTTSPILLYVVLGSVLLRLISKIIIHKKVLKRLKEKQLLLFSLLWEPVHLLLMLVVGFIGLFTKTTQWK
ncbi:N-acetylglucosaminyltransferase [hydrothermal vent metagenome]|uniref:N-acetylglucosaminyltransferase n=1 Tax=hydrothermal vent metagenome TaxID=652676 RepID=A0A3B0USK1_9ZZZZ